MSYSEDVTVIISMAQHASPIVNGHTDELCAQRATSSSRASMNCPGLTVMDLGFLATDHEGRLTPHEAALLPNVGVADREHHDEHDHLQEPKDAQRMHLHGPRIERRRFDVEDHEQHRDQIKPYRKPPHDRRGWFDSAFVGFTFVRVWLRASQKAGQHAKEQRRRKRYAEEDRDWPVRIHDSRTFLQIAGHTCPPRPSAAC